MKKHTQHQQNTQNNEINQQKSTHINKNLPTSIRHGPITMGGMDLYDVRTEAGIEAIKYMRDAVYQKSEAGKLILINVQHSQLESGITQPILEHPNIHLPYLTPTWITSIRQYLHRHNLTITLTDTYDIKPKGKEDLVIMSADCLVRVYMRLCWYDLFAWYYV